MTSRIPICRCVTDTEQLSVSSTLSTSKNNTQFYIVIFLLSLLGMFIHYDYFYTVYQTFALARWAIRKDPHDLAITRMTIDREKTQNALHRMSASFAPRGGLRPCERALYDCLERREAGFGHEKVQWDDAPRGGLWPCKSATTIPSVAIHWQYSSFRAPRGGLRPWKSAMRRCAERRALTMQKCHDNIISGNTLTIFFFPLF